MNERPLSVTATRGFILLNALLWSGFGILVAANAHPALKVPPWVRWSMALASLGIAAVLVLLFVLLGKRKRSAFFLALAFFVGLSLVTLFDEFGLVDLVVLAINLAPLILLIKDKAWYLEE